MLRKMKWSWFVIAILGSAMGYIGSRPCNGFVVMTSSSSSSSSRKSFENWSKTFGRVLEIETWRRPELRPLGPILGGFETACKGISAIVSRVHTDEVTGGVLDIGGDMNVQGEIQTQIDVVANRILTASLCSPGGMNMIASEEEELPVFCSTVVDNTAFSGEYAAVFDPLDGSTNTQAGLPVGTILGVYRQDVRGVLQKGDHLVAAGYCLYGARTEMVITYGNGVMQFTLDSARGEFILTQPFVRVPLRGNWYSANEANNVFWEPPTVKEYFDKMKTSQDMEYRYVGALVADIHRILHTGGLFAYPADRKNMDGKLRLLYEAIPISYIVEQAGGAAISGHDRILDIEPTDIHQRTPFFAGSRDDVFNFASYLTCNHS